MRATKPDRLEEANTNKEMGWTAQNQRLWTMRQPTGKPTVRQEKTEPMAGTRGKQTPMLLDHGT